MAFPIFPSPRTPIKTRSPTRQIGNCSPKAGDDGGFPGIALRYTIDTSLLRTPTRSSKVRLNTATQNAATQAFVDLTDKDGVDITALLTALGVERPRQVSGALAKDHRSDKMDQRRRRALHR